MSPCHGLHLLFIYFIFSCYFYLMLGSIRFHVPHWFLFNERHWFALIKSSLITMKLTASACVHHGFSTGKPPRIFGRLQNIWINLVAYPVLVIHVVFFPAAVPPRGLKHKYVQLCVHLHAYQPTCMAVRISYFKACGCVHTLWLKSWQTTITSSLLTVFLMQLFWAERR